ncbi:hypothetical protein [Enterococcus sp. AZ126]|uniref:hypothetical protein n=1 Tax=Enterococcus sp. AZ126 TaxID=2774635 RepID=UPI003F1FF430
MAGAASTVFSGGVGAIAVPAINASGLAVLGHGAGVFTSAWASLGDGYLYEDNSYTNKNGEWGAGGTDSSELNVQKHFKKHGDEVGASTIDEYKRKAEEFARTVKKGVKPSNVGGATPGVRRYRKMENILT